jgi:hypothetical protein
MPPQPYPWENPERDSYADMNYLLSEGAICRYLIAAHHLRSCPQVVEIGGFKTPITRFLTHHPQSVVVVDPLIEPFRSDELHGRPCRVEHVRTTFQAHEFSLPAGGYGLVLLGASMKYFSEDDARRRQEWAKLRALVANAQVAVLEHPVQWPLGREIVKRLLAAIDHDLVVSVDLDLKRSPGMDGDHFLRRLRIVKPRGSS